MPKPVAERIAALKQKQEKLAARLNTLSAVAKKEDRKRDTRRKIVVGGSVLLAMEKDPILAERVKAALAQTVGRPIDREVVADLLPPSPAGAAGMAALAAASATDAGRAGRAAVE
jgi:hypothetical protein